MITLLEQIGPLQAKVAERKACEMKPSMEFCTKTGYILERFLGESAMYAETITEYKTAQSRRSDTPYNPIRLPEEVQSCKGISTSVLNAVPNDIISPLYELWTVSTGRSLGLVLMMSRMMRSICSTPGKSTSVSTKGA